MVRVIELLTKLGKLSHELAWGKTNTTLRKVKISANDFHYLLDSTNSSVIREP
jgi:hypothetical protein